MEPITDLAGRSIAPPQTTYLTRPMGAWDMNISNPIKAEPAAQQAVLRVICAWHPGFDRFDPANRGASHSICPTCAARMNAELDALEASGR